jgi:hypothetical protein
MMELYPDPSVRSKVKQLFETRRICEQCEDMSPHMTTVLPPILWQLQLCIYRLDKYFEKTWTLSPRSIQACWSDILTALDQINEGKQDAEGLVRDIRCYQQIEERLRKPNGQSFPDLLNYYRLKSCDVRLARNLIARASASSKSEIMERLQGWEIFDLISEVCDDLLDIDEDLNTFNGNRFLLGIRAKGSRVTLEEYHRFRAFLCERLNALQCRNRSRNKSGLPCAWASLCLTELDELLYMRTADIEKIATDCSRNLCAAIAKEAGDQALIAHTNTVPFPLPSGVGSVGMAF